MKQKTLALLITTSFIVSYTFVFAQTLDTTTPAPEPVITPEEDTTPPGFISVATTASEETQASIVWTTDEMAYGYIEYGETQSYGVATPQSSQAAMDHTVSITGLQPGTTYHFRIVAEDESGNRAYSKNRVLETAVEAVAVDNVPPEITEVSVAHSTTESATIRWTTNELAQGKIEYGTTAEYGLATAVTSEYASEHSIELSGLDDSTEYYFRVVAQDESGNEATSPDEIFITESPPTAPTTPETTEDSTTGAPESPTQATTTPVDTTSDATATSTPLTISHVETASVSTSTATMVWSTNEPATSQVFYGQTETYTSSSLVTTAYTTSHAARLTDLMPGTNYFYKVASKNAAGEIIEKSAFEFNTLFKQKTVAVALTIANVTVNARGTSTATIVFTTDRAAAGKINYGTTTGYEETDGGHDTLLTNHSHPLFGLVPNTLYHFETVVWDSAGNETIYENLTFTTLPQPSAPQSTSAPMSAPAGGGAAAVPSVSAARPASRPTPTKVVGKPVVTKVEPLDKQVLLVWQAAMPASGLKTVIVRGEHEYFVAPNQGTVLYQGNSGRFVDSNLQNGKKYYYVVFRVNHRGTYSSPLRFTIVPKQGKTQSQIIATPPVVQKTPIYTFSKALSRGDNNKHVEHLQVLLASESSLYPKGLITGYFGPLTEDAVKNFQKRHKLPITGMANMATLKKLEKLSSIEVVKDKAAVYENTLSRDLKIGLRGGDVSLLQQFLVNAEVYPEAFVTGYFGQLTRAAVQRFQREQNITPASGHFGPLTKKRVLNLIRLRSVSF